MILLGAPGVGKSTHSANITKMFDIPTISTGDILRENIKQGTELGNRAKTYIEAGELVPDEIILDIVRERLDRGDTKNGYLLDGFPRTIAQAERFDSGLARRGKTLDRVLYLSAPKEVLLKRIATRQICPKCGTAFRIDNGQEEICSMCGARLEHRLDDEVSTTEKRIDVYIEQTEPVVEHYKEKGLLMEFDASPDMETVQAGINEALKAI